MYNQSVISKDFEVRFINDTIDVAGKTRCQVLVRVHSTDDLLLCTLVDGLIFQQNLNLTLMPGEKATFHAKGGKVHLTGYSKSHLEDNSQLFRDEEWEDKISQRDSENQNRIGVPEEDCIDEILEEVQTVTSQELVPDKNCIDEILEEVQTACNILRISGCSETLFGSPLGGPWPPLDPPVTVHALLSLKWMWCVSITESSPVQVKQEILDNHSLDSLDVCAPADKKTSLVSVKTEEPYEGSCSSQQEQPESSSADAHDESRPFTCDIKTTMDTSTQHPDVECIQEAIALSRSPSLVPEHHNIPATEQNEVQNHQMLLLQVSQRQ